MFHDERLRWLTRRSEPSWRIWTSFSLERIKKICQCCIEVWQLCTGDELRMKGMKAVKGVPVWALGYEKYFVKKRKARNFSSKHVRPHTTRKDDIAGNREHRAGGGDRESRCQAQEAFGWTKSRNWISWLVRNDGDRQGSTVEEFLSLSILCLLHIVTVSCANEN